MGRQALYRKYRPTDLHEVVGQNHVVSALEAALSAQRIAHAYLLTGPRGVGKTSVARILARRINQLPAEHDIALELDILEIDAASNRGIDEIRALRDKISVAPARLQYKVYIIDEVHMLTREAFNALLKTLEEPPAHAVFILATTEVHKLPDTVISRTQRFDFRPVRADDMRSALAVVAQREHITIDEDAVALIAQLSAGGFRDALSLLDQLSVQKGNISRAMVAEIAGVGDDSVLRRVLQLACCGDFQAALTELNNVWQRGGEPTLVLEHCLHLLRTELIHPPQEADDRNIPEADVFAALECLSQAAKDMKTTPIPSLPLELALWRLAKRGNPPTPIQPTTPAKVPAKPDQPQQPASQPAAALPKGALSPDLITAKTLSIIKSKNNSLYAVLRSGEPVLEGDRFVVRCRFRFHKERIEEHKNRQFIEAVLQKVAGQPIEMLVIHTGGEPPEPTQADEELVASALEILGGEVVEE